MIYQSPGFQRRYGKLVPELRARVNAAILRFESAVGHPHDHAGISLRPYGGFLEFRAGLNLRILAVADAGDFLLVCVGNHDEIRAFVNNR